MVLCALSIFGIVALILIELVSTLRPGMEQIRAGASSSRRIIDPSTGLPLYWDPVNGHFSALPFVYGTLVSSFLALLMAVPLAIGVAIFLTEMCPRILRGPLAFITELLAAIPSIIYGLWAVFVLVPLLREHVNPAADQDCWAGRDFSMTSNPTGLGFLAAAVILAIMILPIISSLTREVMTAVPHSQREAVLALGATRWEMIRMGVLRNARIGIVGAVILGLGRALGETMAVTMVIGNTPEIHRSLLSNGAFDGISDCQRVHRSGQQFASKRTDRDWPCAVYCDHHGECASPVAGVGSDAGRAGAGVIEEIAVSVESNQLSIQMAVVRPMARLRGSRSWRRCL